LSLLELQAEIDKKTEDQISRILDEARQEAEKVVAEANVRAEILKDERGKALMKEFDAEGRAQLAISRMDRKGELLLLKREWAQRAFGEAEKRIAGMAEKSGLEYRELLGKLILEGVAKMKGSRFIVEANSRDLQLIKKEMANISVKAAAIKRDKVELETRLIPKSGLGGAVISTEDSAQNYNNTLEARLAAVTQNFAGEVHKVLFAVGNQSE
jgi:vacuolar-type H+-ATPase subunit E/Vma4